MYKKLKIEFIDATDVKFAEDGSIELKARCRSYDPEYRDDFEDDNMPHSYPRFEVPLVLPAGVEMSKESIETAILAKEGYTESY